MIDDISHEGLRVLLREEGVFFQRVKTWKRKDLEDGLSRGQQVEIAYTPTNRSWLNRISVNRPSGGGLARAA